MVEVSIVKLCAAIVASLMAAATFGFFTAAILANSKYRDLQAELAQAEERHGGTIQPD